MEIEIEGGEEAEDRALSVALHVRRAAGRGRRGGGPCASMRPSTIRRPPRLPTCSALAIGRGRPPPVVRRNGAVAVRRSAEDHAGAPRRVAPEKPAAARDGIWSTSASPRHQVTHPAEAQQGEQFCPAKSPGPVAESR